MSYSTENSNTNESQPFLKEIAMVINDDTVQFRGEDSSTSGTSGEKGTKGEEGGVPRTGSFAGATFNMINGPLGAGMLSFPYTFYCTGVVAGLVLSGCVIIFSTFSLMILARCSFYSNQKFREENEGKSIHGQQSYQQCVEIHLGTFWRRVCELILLLYGSLVLVIYYVVLGQFIKPVMDVVFPGQNFYNDEKFIIVTFSIVFIYPLLLLREIKKLGFSSFLSVVASFYLVGMIIGVGIYHVATHTMGPGQKTLAVLQTKNYSGTYFPILFIAVPMKMSGYMCHVLMFPVSYELKGGSSKKMNIIIVIAVVVVSCIYISLGLFGWFAFGSSVQDNLLNNFSGDSVLGNVGRAALGLNLVLSLPIQHYSARLAIMTFFWGSKKKEFGTCLYLLVTTIYFFCCVFVALFVPALSILFGFIGATCCVTFMFFFPGLMAWKSLAKYEGYNRCRKWFWRLVAISFFILWMFIGSTGFVASLLQLINKYKVQQNPQQKKSAH